jgi:hypothetical protein
MALEIRGIPVLYGESAERFIRSAEEAERNPHTEPLAINHDDIERMEERAKDFIARHGGLKNIKFK